MTIANPLVVTYNTVAKNLPRINQDNYGSEYFLNDGTLTFRVKIRHSLEAADKSGFQHDRHNVELTVTTLATSTVPESFVQFYTVFRDNPSQSSLVVNGYAAAAFLGLTTTTLFNDMYGWAN
jgi:hypothetical protein